MFWLAGTPVGVWVALNVGNRIDPMLMRATGGRIKLAFRFPTVLLTHTGAKSGKKRTTPLAYFTDRGNVILIASRGGHTSHPAWYHNVVANPEVELWAHGGGGRYRAKEAKGNQRTRLWRLATEFYPGYAKYQEHAGDRRIPVIICSPEDLE
jgi:deazaflavin-dependent oxidoreductase (nitroreductase family)